jgi:hypothetical protein
VIKAVEEEKEKKKKKFRGPIARRNGVKKNAEPRGRGNDSLLTPRAL